MANACVSCLRRSWLIGMMGSHLDFRVGRMIDALELDDEALIGLTSGELNGRLERAYSRFDATAASEIASGARGAWVSALCRCDDRYPVALRGVRASPAVLWVAGGLDRFVDLSAGDAVALVGSRRATAYGLDVGRKLGRGVSASGLTVVSGMALGVDAAAHEGATAAGGRTIAVIPGFAAQAYPRAQRGLHRRILAAGSVVSETGPGTTVRRWMMPARNRIIAGLSRLVIMVQGAERSGAGLTVLAAREYGRLVGAVPGSVLLEQSAGPNTLLADGAIVIRDAQDVLDAVFGHGERQAAVGAAHALEDGERRMVDAIRAGADTVGALAQMGHGGEPALAMLARLEIAGVLTRGPGGRYILLG